MGATLGVLDGWLRPWLESRDIIYMALGYFMLVLLLVDR